MIPLINRGDRLPWGALVLMLGVGIVCSRVVLADDPVTTCLAQVPKGGRCPACHKIHQGKRARTWGFDGPSRGFQGFGLGYHRGYGYGGDAFGVGPDGGYPFYGGPGYPHCEPVLRRFGRINPFPHFGGPGFPIPDHPHFFGDIPPVVPSQPVITIGDDHYDTGYGQFTGAVPYSESYLAPFTTRDGTGGSSGGVGSDSPSAPATNTAPDPKGSLDQPRAIRSLGVDTAPVIEAGGVRGLKVLEFHPESLAEHAGLHVGDVIQSINGHLTEVPGNLTWIITEKAPDNLLTVKARSVSDRKELTIMVRLP